MSDNGKKTPNRGSRSQNGKKNQPVTKSAAKSTGNSAKSGNSGKKPALLAQNMNGRRNVGTRSQKQAPVSELEEKGFTIFAPLGTLSLLPTAVWLPVMVTL